MRFLVLIMVVLALTLAGVASGWTSGLFDPWIASGVTRLLKGARGFTGEVREARVGARWNEILLVGFEARATEEKKVLRAVTIPVGVLEWRWRQLRWGEAHFDLHGIAPTVVSRARPEHLEPTPPKPAEAGMVVPNLDTRFSAGTYVWLDERQDPVVDLALYPVDGTLVRLGLLPGGGQLHALASSPGGGLVAATGLLDFWGADHNAFDVRFRLREIGLPGLAPADLAYGGVSMASGRMRGQVAITFDPGERELWHRQPFRAGVVQDVDQGRIVAELEVVEAALADAPLDHVSLERIALSADGPTVGPDPFEVRANAEGLLLRVTPDDLERLGRDMGMPRPGVLLKRLPTFELPRADVDDVTLQIVLRGRVHRAVDLDLSVGDLDNHDTDDEPPWARLEGTVLDAPVWAEARGELLGARRPQSVRGALEALDARRLSPGLEMVGFEVADGQLSGELDIQRSAGGAWDGHARLHGQTLSITGERLDAAVDAVDLELVGGRGDASSVRVASRYGPTLEHRADTLALAWSPDIVVEGPLRIVGTTDRLLVREAGGASPWSVRVGDATVQVETDRDVGTLRVDLAAALADGGRVGARIRGDDVDVAARDLSLAAVSDVAEHFAGIGFAAGTADASLRVRDGRSDASLDGEAVVLHGAPVPLSAARVAVDGAWQTAAGPASAVISGTAAGVDTTLDLDALDLDITPSGAVPGVPVISRFEVTDSALTLRVADRPVVLDEVALVLRDATLDDGPRGRVRLRAAAGDGVVRARARRDIDAPGRLFAELEGISLCALNPWLRGAADLDVAGGTLSGGVSAVVDAGHLDGRIVAELEDVDVLQASDLWDGPGAWLRSAAAGAVVDLLSRRGRGVVEVQLSGTPASPELDVRRGVLESLGRRFGVVPGPLPAPPQVGDTAVIAERLER